MSISLEGGALAVPLALATTILTYRQQANRARLDARSQEARLQAEFQLQAERLQADFQLQADRLQMEFRTESMAEEAIKSLLLMPQWKKRRFKSIQNHVGGFEADDLRQLLVRAGALTFWDGETEWWGLRERNTERLETPADST